MTRLARRSAICCGEREREEEKEEEEEGWTEKGTD